MSELVAIRKPAKGIPRPARLNLRGLTREALADWIRKELGGPAFRAGQVFSWIHEHHVDGFEAMTNLSKADRAKLDDKASVARLSVDGVFVAADGTRKLRLETADGHYIESVLIPNDDRGYTLCISSQVGCSMTCRFCATASLGFQRNLDTWEIVDQVYRAQDVLAELPSDDPDHPDWHPRLTNVVYMGMGEPLHNFNQVRDSLALLTHPEGAGLAGRRITVSTSGLVPAIERFAREGLGDEVGLAISLNATTDPVRDEVMPINNKWKIDELLAAVREVPTSRRRDITFEYVLLGGVNDTDADADRLADLIGDLHCHVNAIPFNPHPHAPYERPSAQRIRRFIERARARGLRVYLRTPRGDDIGAACGQLALEGENAR